MGRIQELMTVKPRTVKTGDSVVDAAKLMRGEDAGIAPIVDGDRLVGVVTDRDIAIRVVAEGKDPSTTKVEEIASRNLVTVEPGQDLDDALRLMAQHQVRRLPVVDDGKLVGIVAQADVAKHADAKRTGKVVEEIST
jgi:CBS domain-containing protein